MKKFLALILAISMVLGMASFAVAEDLPVITIMFHGSDVSDDAAVLEKVNEYIADKVGAKLEVVWGTWGDFDEKSVNALKTMDDSIDMVFTCSWSANEYNTFAREGYFLKLDDLIAEYGADLTAAIPASLMSAATVEGPDGAKAIYAVNGYKDMATQNTWDINVTLLNELGYTIDDVKAMSFYDFGELFAKAKEVKGDSFYPFLVEPFVLERMVTNSIIVAGDAGSTSLLSYYMNPEDVTAEGVYGNKMLNKYATPEFEKFVTKMHEYYEAGYVNPSVAIAETSNDARAAALKNADYLIGTQSYSLGYEYVVSAERGIEVQFIPCTDAYVDTTASQGAMVAVTAISKYPVESFKFLNLLNSDAYLMTLLNYGIEGVHYNVIDGMVQLKDETAISTNGMGKTTFLPDSYEVVDGLIQLNDEARKSYYSPWTNGMGNITLLPDSVAEGVGFHEYFKAYYAAAKAIPILGFSFNNSEVTTEMGSLANVAAEYALAMMSGATDPAKLPEFLEKLDANGMQTYVDAANAQLDAYMAQ